MNIAIGTTAIYFGVLVAAAAIAVLVVGLTNRRGDMLRTTPIFAVGLAVSALVAFGAMENALITRDFTVRYVAENGSSHTPALYNFAALWGALEGSILLWGLILTVYLCAMAWKFRRRLDDRLMAWAMLVMFVVCLFFFGLMATSADPFVSFSPPPGFDGPGPNPLLQNNLLMAYHPPFLYLGFVGFTVPFSFAIAALVTGRLGEGWLVETRRWTLFAFAFLTMGIILGAWWSYEVLGWGGYWAWDPVENASLLPWLTGTAYLHSVMVQERRGMLRVWNLSLLCATFSLTILGTFLTRSGVLNSVHTFTESGIGPTFLVFFAVIVAVSVGLIFWRGDRLRSPGRIDSPVSREGAFLVNNLLFATFALIVLLGTIFPLLMEAWNDSQITVGPPYFNRMIGPIVIALLFLMGVAPALPWRKASGETLRQRLLIPAWAGVATVVFAVAVGARGVVPLVVFGLGGFVVGASVRQIVLATRRQGWRGLVGRTNGGMIVHIGVVIVAVGIVASSAYIQQADFTLEQGQTAHLAGHSVTYEGSSSFVDGNVNVSEARIRIDDTKVYAPKLKQFANASQVIGTPSVRSTPVDDVYLSLLTTPDEPGGPITVRVFVEPLVTWIWAGGILIFVGSFLAAFPGRRRRRPTDPTSAPVPDAAVTR